MKIRQLRGQAARLLRCFKGGQVTVEATLGIIVLFVFFVGMINLFFAFNRNIVSRQYVYQDSRLNLGGGNLGTPDAAASSEASIHFYGSSDFHVFPEER